MLAKLVLTVWTLLTGPSQPTALHFPDFSFGSWLGAADSYLYEPVEIPLVSSLSASFTITTKKSPVFRYDTELQNTCLYPAHARLWFAKNGWESGDPTARWWAITGVELGAGTFSTSIPLDPAQWSDVDGTNGAQLPIEFASAAANASLVGLSFGGGCFYGHGVYVTGGSAKFTLIQFAVN